jgi:hypothetical protein
MGQWVKRIHAREMINSSLSAAAFLPIEASQMALGQ